MRHFFKAQRVAGMVAVLALAVLVWQGGSAAAPNDQITALPEAEPQLLAEESQEEAEPVKREVAEPVKDDQLREAPKEEDVQEGAEPKEETEQNETVPKEEGAKKEPAEEVQPVEEEEAPPVFTGPVNTFGEAKTMYPTTGLNVRTGPGTEYEAVGRLTFNEPVVFLGTTNNGWYQLEFGDLFCYVSGNYLSETKQEPVQQAAASPSHASGGVIIIGDSRCVQMQAATGGGGCAWICQNSMGYKWMSETAIPQADPSVGKGTKVVICLGVNDPGNVRNYAELVNAKAAEWGARGAKVYYVSVNPVWENPHVTQEQVDVFNSTMPGLLQGVTWIDTQSWMIQNGYRIVDGLHYDDPTSVNVFNLIMGSI